MERLEMIGQFIKLHGNRINPDIRSLLYCQSGFTARIEMHFHSKRAPYFVDLKFIEEYDNSKTQEEQADNMKMFNPDSDIVDNARKLIELDSYTLINCFENIFTQEAIDEIVAEHQSGQSL